MSINRQFNFSARTFSNVLLPAPFDPLTIITFSYLFFLPNFLKMFPDKTGVSSENERRPGTKLLYKRL